MSENASKGNLNKLKEKAKEKWSELSDNDRESLTGDVNQLADLLQHRLGYAKEQAASAAHEFMKGFKDSSKNEEDSDSNIMKSAGKAANEFGDISKDVRDTTVKAAKQIKEEAGEYGKAVVEFVKHKPYQSMAIAVFAGLALGLLCRKNQSE